MVEPNNRSTRRRLMAAPLSALVLMTVAAGALASCNTTQGFGEDVQQAGQGIEHSAEKNK